jgi:hypothetical protein
MMIQSPHKKCMCFECCAAYVANRPADDRRRSADNLQASISWNRDKLLDRADELLAEQVSS